MLSIPYFHTSRLLCDRVKTVPHWRFDGHPPAIPVSLPTAQVRLLGAISMHTQQPQGQRATLLALGERSALITPATGSVLASLHGEGAILFVDHAEYCLDLPRCFVQPDLVWKEIYCNANGWVSHSVLEDRRRQMDGGPGRRIEVVDRFTLRSGVKMAHLQFWHHFESPHYGRLVHNTRISVPAAHSNLSHIEGVDVADVFPMADVLDGLRKQGKRMAADMKEGNRQHSSLNLGQDHHKWANHRYA